MKRKLNIWCFAKLNFAMLGLSYYYFFFCLKIPLRIFWWIEVKQHTWPGHALHLTSLEVLELWCSLFRITILFMWFSLLKLLGREYFFFLSLHWHVQYLIYILWHFALMQHKCQHIPSLQRCYRSIPIKIVAAGQEQSCWKRLIETNNQLKMFGLMFKNPRGPQILIYFKTEQSNNEKRGASALLWVRVALK